MLCHSLHRFTPALLLLIAQTLFPAPVTAQVPPVLTVSDASNFEGNAGTNNLVFTVTLDAPSSGTVTANLSAIPLTGSSFNPATGGASCSGAVDFVQLSNVPFSIPANTTTATFNITICGNSVVEANEHIFVSLTGVSGAQCFEGTCNALGTIRNDDGPPGITIDNISISEPVIGERNASFPVILSHPSPSAVSVNFATRNGTALGTSLCGPIIGGGSGDYKLRSGVLTIAANTLAGSVVVPICGDRIEEATQTFFVDLSNPVNATIARASAQGSIRDTTLSIGGFELSPDNARVQVDEIVTYTVVWTVPDGRNWRDLNSIDLRMRKGEKTALWISWDESSNTFKLCQQRGDEDESDHEDQELECGAAAGPGEPIILETRFARLHLAQSSVQGSGPTGASVTLNLAVSFRNKATGQHKVELAATDDFSNRDDFVHAGTVLVKPSRVKISSDGHAVGKP